MTAQRAWLGLGGMVFGMVWLASPGLGDAGQEESMRSVRSVLDRQVADWNKGDLDSFLAGYWNSPKVVFQSGGRRFDGWEAMRERIVGAYRAEGRDGPAGVLGIDVVPLGPEAVLAQRSMATDHARRHHARRPLHRHLPQTSRGLEDRARSYIRRRGEAGREEGRVRAMRAVRNAPHAVEVPCDSTRPPCSRESGRSPPSPGPPGTSRPHARWPRPRRTRRESCTSSSRAR